MVDFVDIAPLVEVVDVRGHKIEVRGVSIEALGILAYRFDDLRSAVTKDGATVETLLGLGEEVVAALIASGCKQLTEASARNLSLSEKAEIVGAMARLTMPKGLRPFVESLKGLFATFPVNVLPAPAATPAAGSQAPSPDSSSSTTQLSPTPPDKSQPLAA
jgi:hypothetical protein